VKFVALWASQSGCWAFQSVVMSRFSCQKVPIDSTSILEIKWNRKQGGIEPMKKTLLFFLIGLLFFPGLSAQDASAAAMV